MNSEGGLFTSFQCNWLQVKCNALRVLTTFEKVLSVIFDAELSELCNFPLGMWKIKHWQNCMKHWERRRPF